MSCTSILNIYWISVLISIILLHFLSFFNLSFNNWILVNLYAYGKTRTIKNVKLENYRFFYFPKRLFYTFYIVAFWTFAYVLYVMAQIYVYKHKSIFLLNKILNIFCSNNWNKKIEMSVYATRSYFLCILFLIHVTRRLYESLLVNVYSKDKKCNINILHIVVGYSFYIFLGLSLASVSPIIGDHRFITLYIFKWPNIKINPWHLNTINIIGIILFIISNISQYKCNKILGNIRKGGKAIESEKYAIPQGFLFKYVTCPHYTFECLLYFSSCLILADSFKPDVQFTTWYMAVIFVFVNQICSGYMQHLWYLKEYGSKYPNRYIIFPFLF